MALTFKLGTKLILDNGSDRYEFLVSEASASQTYSESSQSVKTIHNPNLVERTFSTEKSPASLNFSVYIEYLGPVSRSIIEWFNTSEDVPDYFTLQMSDNQAKQYDVYIDSGATIYHITNCVGQNISFRLDSRNLLQMDVSAVGSNLTTVSNIPATGSLISQITNKNFYNDSITITGYNNINAVTCELTRDISWTSAKTVHDIGSIYTVSNPIINRVAISGSITTYKKDDTLDHSDVSLIDIIYGNGLFRIYLHECSVTERWNMQDIHKKVYDYNLLPTALSAFIKF